MAHATLTADVVNVASYATLQGIVDVIGPGDSVRIGRKWSKREPFPWIDCQRCEEGVIIDPADPRDLLAHAKLFCYEHAHCEDEWTGED